MAVSLSAHPCIPLSAYLSVCLSVPVSLSAHPCILLSGYLSICLPACLAVFVTAYLSVSLFACLPFCQLLTGQQSVSQMFVAQLVRVGPNKPIFNVILSYYD